jgi:dihydrofolate reductase
MRNVILQEFVTLDGLAAGPHGKVDFVPRATKDDRSFGAEQMRLLETVDTILLGRVTYQLFAGYWPNITSGEEKAFADKLNATPKIVFSKSLERAPWGNWQEATIVRTSAADEVVKLKRQAGKDLVIWGSISLAQSLLKDGLIDDYRLVVCPMVLGDGRPLFGGTDERDLRFLEAKHFDRGAVMLTYSALRAHDGRTADEGQPGVHAVR